MKKKLLVTIGDSLTEGVGCYDYERNPELLKYNAIVDPKDKHYQRHRFHQYGWPNRVGRELGFDKVINLGLGGAANSYHVKIFLHRILESNLKGKFDISVIWMMTEPTRISFYDGYLLRNFLPGKSKHEHGLGNAYLKTIENIDLGSVLEQAFYIKVMEQICQNNNFELLLTYWNGTVKFLLNEYNSPYNLFSSPPSIIVRAGLTEEDKSIICGHPNESGYKKISKVMISGIKRYKPHFIKDNPKENIDWEWDGEPITDPSDFSSLI